MVKTLEGNDVKVGDTILFSNVMMKVEKIIEPSLIGATGPLPAGPGKVQAMQMPGTLICVVAISFNPNQLLSAYTLKTPPENKAHEA